MTILDISQSAYIFKQGELLGFFGAVFCIALLTYAAVCFRKGRTSGNEDTRKAENLKAIMLSLFSLAIWFIGFMPAIKDSYKLKLNGIETSGKTIKWIKGAKQQRYVEYSFTVDGQTFTDQCGIVYNGKQIKDIRCPKGEYIVIYEKNNPSNSIMDFKRAVNNTAANTSFPK